MAIEDFTTYTEDDDGGDLTVTAPKVLISTVQYGQNNSRVHKDFGVDYFDDWTFEFDFEHTQAQNKTGFAIVTASNAVKEWYILWLANDDAVGVLINRALAGTYGLYLRDCNNHNSDKYVHSLNTQYWCDFDRTGVNCVLDIYTDAARTVWVATLTISSVNVDYRYMLAYTSMNYLTESPTASGYIQNLDLSPAVGDVSAGIKIWSGAADIELARDNTSPVKIRTPAATIGVEVVATAHADASAIRIFDGVAVKSLKKKV